MHMNKVQINITLNTWKSEWKRINNAHEYISSYNNSLNICLCTCLASGHFTNNFCLLTKR